MSAHVIWRIQKLKQRQKINASHAGRSASVDPATHVDPRGRIERLIWPDDPTLADAVDARIDAAGAKPRSNSVRAVEFVLSASPEFFRPDDPAAYGHWRQDRLDAWRERAITTLRQEFGDRLVSAELHLDEATPHIQGIVVPITDDNRLSARDIFGKNQLRMQQQKTIGAAFLDLGIKPGIGGSTSNHVRVKQFYGAANKPIKIPSIEVPPFALRDASRKSWAERETKRVKQQTRPTRDRAKRADLAERQRREARTTADQARDEAKRLANELRDVPLEAVLEAAGWDRDPEDQSQWLAPGGASEGRVSLSGAKWYDHAAETGGGKAIDLTKHLTGHDFQGAVAWLGDRFGNGAAAGAVAARSRETVAEAQAEAKPLDLPQADQSQWPRVRRYMTQTRRIAEHLVDQIAKRGQLWADARGNAVFSMFYGKRVVGAEIRGTGERSWQGLARGTSRNDGGFHAAVSGPAGERPISGPIVLVESAIDALSYAELHAQDGPYVVISTAGARPRTPAFLPDKARLVCAYDADAEGDRCAARIGAERQRPPHGKDWNDTLKAWKSGAWPPQSEAEPEPASGPSPM